jgi:hypothetical protein
MRKPALATVLLATLILLTATPAFADTRLTRYHCDLNFNQVVGAQFQVWWPCETDWTSWGVTSGFKEVIENWDDCEEGPQSRTCWYQNCCGQWVEVSCP